MIACADASQREPTEDERVAVDFYCRNPSAALVDLARRTSGRSEPTEAQIEAAEAKPVAWMDEFGNAFPLDAWKPAKRAGYLDYHKKAWKPLFTHPAPQLQSDVGGRVCIAGATDKDSLTVEPTEAQIHDVLFDGYSVMSALSEQAKARTSAENVSDVLDAVVRVLRAALAAKE